MNKSEIISRLKNGNKRYIEDNLLSEFQDSSRRKSLVDGQNPMAVILGCADSRIVPELIFDTGIGELFVVRVGGNVANMSTIASIEYAVAMLNTQIIVVLAHENCGAITIAIKGRDYDSNVMHLLSHLTPAINQSEKNASINTIAKKNASITVSDLINKSKIISDAVNSDQLEILPAYYNLKTGIVDFL